MNESVARFGEGRSLVGIVSEPAPGAARAGAPGVVLLNAGFIHRIGPHRLYVNLARRLAGIGLTCLRFDLSGIGDSRLRRDHLPIEESAPLEARQAMDYLQSSRGVERFVLAGLCTGAENAVRVAGLDPRVAGAVCMNYQGDAADPLIADRHHARYYLRHALFDPASWGRALSGRTDYAAVARLLAVRLWSQLSPGARSAPKAVEVATGLRALAERDVSLLLLYSDGDPGLDYLHFYLGKDVDALERSGHVQVRVFEGANHMFAPLQCQERVVHAVAEWLTTRTIPVPAAPPLAAADSRAP